MAEIRLRCRHQSFVNLDAGNVGFLLSPNLKRTFGKVPFPKNGPAALVANQKAGWGSFTLPRANHRLFRLIN